MTVTEAQVEARLRRREQVDLLMEGSRRRLKAIDERLRKARRQNSTLHWMPPEDVSR